MITVEKPFVQTENGDSFKIGLQCTNADAKLICELLSPWEVSFTLSDDADIIIKRGSATTKLDSTIVIPTDDIDFSTLTKSLGLKVSKKLGNKLLIPAFDTIFTITPQYSYSYSTIKNESQNDNAFVFTPDRKSILLTLDVVAEANRLLNMTLNGKSSITYRTLTSLPIPYSIAPSYLRNLFFRNNYEKIPLLEERVPFDAMRYALVSAIEELSEKSLRQKQWRKAQYVCIITHDIDSHTGLLRSKAVKALEDRYDIKSTWYIPANHFTLENNILKKLSNHGEIGVHGAKHDGKLVYLPKAKVADELRDAKRTLERIADCPMNGFRAPLLQHSSSMLLGVKEAGYYYDSSIPTWEPKHPRTMQPHGLGSIHPTTIHGLVEIPVTLIQDHQLLTVKGMKPRQIIQEWLTEAAIIRTLGGCAVFLAHPEYRLLDNSGITFYEEFLNSLSSDNDALVTTPTQIVSSCPQDISYLSNTKEK